MGQFDANGNFIPDPAVTRMSGPPLSGPGNIIAVNMTGGSIAYEHRSGRLIPGMISSEPRGVFVPELGSEIIDLKRDFDQKKTDRVIYNLPEFLYCVPRKKAPVPLKAGVPIGWRLVPFREAYPNSPERQNPWFSRVIGEIMELGHLSNDGEFIPDYGLPVLPYAQAKDWLVVNDNLRDGTGRSMYFTLPRHGLHGPKTGNETEDVYEFRSGRLIKGLLQKTGNFVPELGSKIMDFKDYEPVTDRRRIYNLPGVLKRIEKK